MCGGGPGGHVTAAFGDEHLGGASADAGDGLESIDDLAEALGQLDDVIVQGGDGRLEPVDVLEQLPQMDRMVGFEAAVECTDELGDLRAHPALGHLGEHGRITFACDERIEHRPARLGQGLGRDRSELDDGVLECLLDALDLRSSCLDEPLAIPRRGPQAPDVGWRHEAAREQSDLEQFAQPGRVLDVGLAPRDGLTWRALTSSSRSNTSPSSSAHQTGSQYEEVASIATCVTCSASSRLRRSTSPSRKLGKVRTCCRRPPSSPGVRTHAVIVFLCTSSAAARATMMSIRLSSMDRIGAVKEPDQLKSLRLVLAATIEGPWQAPASSSNAGSRRYADARSERHPILILRGGGASRHAMLKIENTSIHRSLWPGPQLASR
jgi:hypothetical protein